MKGPSMRKPTAIRFEENRPAHIMGHEGRVVIFITDQAKLDSNARRANALSKGAIERAVQSDAFEKLKVGQVFSIAMPHGLKADAIDIVR
jgi:leucyl aminopeptidase